MGNILLGVGVVLIILACGGFVLGWWWLARSRRELEQYLTGWYGEETENGVSELSL